jgi:hypothetical protein
VNGWQDKYKVTVEARKQINCEHLVTKLAEYAEQAIYQEVLTQELADEYRAQVTTRGIHSGVLTTAIARPCAVPHGQPAQEP